MFSEPGPSTRDDDEQGGNFKQQEADRKILPDTSSGNSQPSTSTNMIDRPNITDDNTEFSIYFREQSILSEYKMMITKNIRRIYVIPSAQNSCCWFGVLFVRTGLYQGAVFRFTITLPETFPNSGCPKVVFQSKVFHPLINYETGEFNIAAGFPNWQKSNRIFELVQFMTKVFYELEPSMPAVNEEADNLLKINFPEFHKRVKKSVRESLDRVYDPPDTDDPHYIRFGKWDPEIHEPIRRQIYEERAKLEEPENATGSSLTEPGTFTPSPKPPFPT